MGEQDLAAIAERFKRLYVPAVTDILDEYQLHYQFAHHGIRPLDHRMKIAGPAFTILGRSSSTLDKTQRLGPRVIDDITPHVVAVYDTMGDQQTGVWGELWSIGAIQRGCAGAVVDGGIRDTAYIRQTGFPMFYRFTCPGDALGRFNIVDYRCPVTLGGVRVMNGDYIFGDEDGVVVIPASLTLEVLEKAEILCEKETRIREELGHDKPLAELYQTYKRF